MDPEKIKSGISALDILTIIFLLLGGIFTVIAIIFALNLNAVQAHSTGDAALFPIIFGAVGAPFLVLGIVFAVISIRKRATLKRLVSDGCYVMADVVDIHPNFNVEVNGTCPYVLECHYQDPATGVLHIFKSRNLFFCPVELQNKQVRVYIDRANMNHYYVDVDYPLPDVQIH